MRVLVTGASGFIGRPTVEVLREAGHLVLTPARTTLPDAVRDLRPDAAILLGWPGGPGRMRDGPANAVAATATLALIDALVAVRCTRIVAAGSCVEALEDHPAGRVPYAQAKRRVHAALMGIPGATCAHVFGVTGPGEPTARAVPQVVRALLDGREVAVSAGTQRRDVLHVEDVARGLVVALERGPGGTLDVCTGDAPPLRTLFERLERETGTSGLVRYGEAEIPVSDRFDAVGDPGPLRALGWRPAWTLDATAAATVRWWRTQR